MKTKSVLALTCWLLLPPLASMASGDDFAGLWSYESLDRPTHGVKPLVGLFLFHDGRFIHQAMHGSEPMDRQLTDAHIGKYQLKSGGVVQFVVETGIVVTPVGETLLAGRSNTSHRVNYKRSGENLFISFANGATEKLVKVPTTKTELINLDSGMLALTDEHFVLVTNSDDHATRPRLNHLCPPIWLAGSGRYQRTGNALRLKALRWFSVQGDETHYAKDETFEATFDGETLQLSDGPSFQVTK